MRILQRFFFIGLAVLAATAVHAQSSTINGRLLGFTAVRGGTAMEPISAKARAKSFVLYAFF